MMIYQDFIFLFVKGLFLYSRLIIYVFKDVTIICVDDFVWGKKITHIAGYIFVL